MKRNKQKSQKGKLQGKENKRLKYLISNILLVVYMVTWLEGMIVAWRDAGIPLLFLWLLTLAIVYGILSHVSLPQSKGARSIISIVSAFLVLFATASTEMTLFLSNATTGLIAVGFALIIGIIFLEMTGVKVGENNIFKHYPSFFGGILLLIVIGIFISAGGMNLLEWNLSISSNILSMFLFFGVIIVAMWALLKEEKK